MTRGVKFWLGVSAALCIAQAACGSSGNDPGTGGATGTASTSTGGATTSHGTGGGGNHGTGGMSGTGGANACVPLGQHCQDNDTCCEGTCPPGGGGNCCGSAGGACDPSVSNPDAYCCLGTTCDKAKGQCVPLTCIGTMYEAVCDQLPGIPCCVEGTQCTPLPGGGGGSYCCAPNGTKLPENQANRCCSNGAQNNGDGTVTCISPP
jgi:hypothetical protein